MCSSTVVAVAGEAPRYHRLPPAITGYHDSGLGNCFPRLLSGEDGILDVTTGKDFRMKLSETDAFQKEN